MHKNATLADGLLLCTAIIWGFAFVAQRAGMEHMGPFLFNGVRFFLGAASLVPLIYWSRSRGRLRGAQKQTSRRTVLLAGLAAGLVLFTGSSLQQIGLVTTTAGNAGFLTGLYVILVPLMGQFLGQQTTRGTWVGACLAVTGMFLLSVQEGFHIVVGDIWVTAGAVFWAGHVLVIGYLVRKVDALVLSCLQFTVCGALSMVTGLASEPVSLAGLEGAMWPILYGGIMSVGLAYTLQVAGQQWVKPSHAAIILSLEGAFAALGGWLILDEVLTLRQLLGCGLMLCGMLASQCWPEKRSADVTREKS